MEKLKRSKDAQIKKTITCTDCGIKLLWTSLAKHRKRCHPRENLQDLVSVEEKFPVKSVVLEDVRVKLVKMESDEEKVNSGLCEYEMIRLENIRQREALFAKLNLEEAKVEALSSIRRKAGDASKRVLQKVNKDQGNVPRRASLRLAGSSVQPKRCQSSTEPKVQRDPEPDVSLRPSVVNEDGRSQVLIVENAELDRKKCTKSKKTVSCTECGVILLNSNLKRHKKRFHPEKMFSE